MARGKHGLSAAQRRAKEAEERVEVLQREKAQMQAKHQREMQELRAELDRLRGDFSSGVRESAAEQVLAAKDSASRVVKEEREKYRARLRDGLRFFFDRAADPRLPFEDYQEFAAIVGISTGELLSWGGVERLNHDQRRMRRSRANLNHQVKRDPSFVGGRRRGDPQ